MSKELEEGLGTNLDFDKLKRVGASARSVLPVAVQDVDSKEVLLIAYVDESALKASLESGLATFWSTSRQELWVKGKTSGDLLELLEVRVNCEQNSLLFLVRQLGGGVCHTKNSEGKTRPTCYYRALNGEKLAFRNLEGPASKSY
jgi:phosphoribosyl-AMP cyclohydrolase